MINVSQNIRTAMTNPIKLVNGEVVIHTLGGENLTFTSTDYLQKMELTQEGGLFLSAVRSGTVNLVGAHHGTLAGLKCDVIAKVAVSYDQQGIATYENIDYGTFYIKEQEIDLEKGTTKLTIIDTIGLMIETYYKRGDFAYPCSVSALIKQVAGKFGLNYDEEAIDALPNADVEIPSAGEDELEIFEESAETTYRDILDMLAGATASIARIKAGEETDTLEFVSVNIPSQETLDFNNYLKVKIKDHFGTVNTVTLAREPQGDNVIHPATYEGDRIEIRLTNNEIIDYGSADNDEKRLAMIVPIYNAVNGLDYTGFEGRTEGHGWYEVGDKITTIDDDTGETVESVLTSVSIAIAGSFKETLKSDTPEQELTDYSTAGSSTKTVWNVQLKTDKQQGEIRGLVQKTDQTNEVVQANYTEFVQTVNQITQAVQKAGGSNLLKNSVGYDKDTDGNFPNWTKTGTVTSQTSPESLNYGAISGSQFDLSANSKIVQRVAVATGTHYVFSARVRKPIVGTARIVLTNGTDTYTVNLPDQTEYIWQQVAITGIVPTVGYLDITVECQSASYFYATDLMFSATDTIAPWQQSASEILNTQVALTDQGVKVKSSTSGDYVQITPLEFAGYSDVSGSEQKVFYLNRDETRIMKLKVKSQITMPPIKIVPITDGNRAGWAFVKTDEEW